MTLAFTPRRYNAMEVFLRRLHDEGEDDDDEESIQEFLFYFIAFSNFLNIFLNV